MSLTKYRMSSLADKHAKGEAEETPIKVRKVKKPLKVEKVKIKLKAKTKR